MPGAFLEARDTEVNKTENILVFLELVFLLGEKVQKSSNNTVERVVSVGKKTKQLKRESEGDGGGW